MTKKNSKEKKASEKKTSEDKEISLKEFHEKFLREARKHPQYAGKFVLSEVMPTTEPSEAEVERTSALTAAGRSCKRYGIDPVNGEMICLEWATD
jgi:hypothetical protein